MSDDDDDDDLTSAMTALPKNIYSSSIMDTVPPPSLLQYSCASVSFQENVHAVLQRVLPIASVHHTGCLCHGLCWTHMDADRTERGPRLFKRETAY